MPPPARRVPRRGQRGRATRRARRRWARNIVLVQVLRDAGVLAQGVVDAVQDPPHALLPGDVRRRLVDGCGEVVDDEHHQAVLVGANVVIQRACPDTELTVPGAASSTPPAPRRGSAPWPRRGSPAVPLPRCGRVHVGEPKQTDVSVRDRFRLVCEHRRGDSVAVEIDHPLGEEIQWTGSSSRRRTFRGARRPTC